jgi:amidase
MHVVSRTDCVYAVDAEQPPVTRVRVGDTFVVETHDARTGRLRRAEQVKETAPDFSSRFPKTNPATGPIYVEGLATGDALRVTILSIELDDVGFMVVKPDVGTVRGTVEEPRAMMVSVSDRCALFADAIEIPLKPMVGFVATAPKEQPVGTAHVGSHGGNMDNPRVAPGACVVLPVEHDGGLLYIGDLHASMGDGEVCGTGIEIGGRVTIRVDIEEDPPMPPPYVQTDELLVSNGFGTTFYDAAEVATEALIGYLVRTYRLDRAGALALASAAGNLRLNQACAMPVDISVRMEFPRSLLVHRV